MMSLTCQSLSLTYGKGVVIERLSFALNPASITVLLGSNGCGKSTLLRGLAGLLKPITGHVALEGCPLSQWPRKKLARRIAFLRQVQETPEGLTVEELVRHGRFPYRSLWGRECREDRVAVAWALRVTDLFGARERSLNTLSGGERQRAWIAMALAQKADILILDEPTTYLDLGHQLEIMQLLRDLNIEYGLTLIMSLHDLNQAIRFSHRALVLQRGRLLADGVPATILEPVLLRQVFQIRASLIEGAADGLPICHLDGPVEQGAGKSLSRERIGDVAC